MPGPITGPPYTTYITGAQLVLLSQADRWAQYLSDPSQGITVTPAQVPTNPTVLQYLLIGGAIIDGALCEANRYSQQELLTLATTTNTSGWPTTGSGILLWNLNASLAYGEFLKFKQLSEEEVKDAAPDYKRALEVLDELNLGIRVLADINGIGAAGLMTSQVMGSVLDNNPLQSVKNQPNFWGFWAGNRSGISPGGSGWQ